MIDGIDLDALQKLTEPKLVLAKDWMKLTPPTL
jgi:hypothetical protein